MRRELIAGVCGAVLLTVGCTAVHAAQAEREPAATVDLTTDAGAQLMHATWRYSDARIVDVTFRAPDARGQPTGAPIATHDISPHAGTADFDDSTWPAIPPTKLREPRGTGRLSFNWYRVNVTVPEHLGSYDPSGAALWLETRLDDYAEVWVNGELARAGNYFADLPMIVLSAGIQDQEEDPKLDHDHAWKLQLHERLLSGHASALASYSAVETPQISAAVGDP